MKASAKNHKDKKLLTRFTTNIEKYNIVVACEANILIEIFITIYWRKSWANIHTSKTGNRNRELPEKLALSPLERLPIAWMASTATAIFTSVISWFIQIFVGKSNSGTHFYASKTFFNMCKQIQVTIMACTKIKVTV